MNIPRTLIGRSIIIKLWPKKRDEKQSFNHEDDEEFGNLRRKLARWAADNAVTLKDTKPLLPVGFNNRVAANWRLLLAVAELAGGDWPKQARDAAERLSRTIRKPSWGLRLLAAFKGILVDGFWVDGNFCATSKHSLTAKLASPFTTFAALDTRASGCRVYPVRANSWRPIRQLLNSRMSRLAQSSAASPAVSARPSLAITTRPAISDHWHRERR